MKKSMKPLLLLLSFFVTETASAGDAPGGHVAEVAGCTAAAVGAEHPTGVCAEGAAAKHLHARAFGQGKGQWDRDAF